MQLEDVIALPIKWRFLEAVYESSGIVIVVVLESIVPAYLWIVIGALSQVDAIILAKFVCATDGTTRVCVCSWCSIGSGIQESPGVEIVLRGDIVPIHVRKGNPKRRCDGTACYKEQKERIAPGLALDCKHRCWISRVGRWGKCVLCASCPFYKDIPSFVEPSHSVLLSFSLRRQEQNPLLLA